MLDTMIISSILLTYSSMSLFCKLDIILLLNGDTLLQKCMLSAVCIAIPTMYIVATHVRAMSNAFVCLPIYFHKISVQDWYIRYI